VLVLAPLTRRGSLLGKAGVRWAYLGAASTSVQVRCQTCVASFFLLCVNTHTLVYSPHVCACVFVLHVGGDSDGSGTIIISSDDGDDDA
jgi:hypothetical protein